MNKFISLLLAISSAVLLALALPNELFSWGNPVLGVIALVPLYLALDRAGSYGEAWLLGAVFGGLAHGLSSYWLWFFQDFRFWTLGSTVLAYMVVYGVLGFYLKGALRSGGIMRPLLFAAVWTVFEWSKSTGFLAYPWGLLPYSWNTVLPAIQIAESTGVYGLSFSLAWLNASIGELACPPAHLISTYTRPNTAWAALIFPRRPGPVPERAALELGHFAFASVLILAIAGYGSLALARDRQPRGMLKAVLVQQNIDSWAADGEIKALEISIRLAREAIERAGRKPDVILFSETVLRRDYDDFRNSFRRIPLSDPLIPFLERQDTRLFTGAPEVFEVDGQLEATNSAILIGPDGKKEGSYAKMHPVPFAEAIPFWEYDIFRRFIQETVGLSSGWTMGSERVVFELPSEQAGTVRFSAPICFEDAFSYLNRLYVLDGAELLVNLTNDSWSMTRSAEIQHFVAARFRSVELRRTLVRSTNGGVTAVVHPDGTVHDMLPLFQEASAFVDIPVYTDETTPYLLWGDWFPALLAFFLAAAALILFIDEIVAARARQARRS